jgi:LytS/YehU family sensor histidine kinase
MAIELPSDWPPELNNPYYTSLRPGWRLETIQLIEKLQSTCRQLQNGLIPSSATALAQNLYASANYAAVSINNRHTTLSFVGPTFEGEMPHQERFCPSVRLCLETGKLQTCRHVAEESQLSNCWATPPRDADDALVPHWLIALPLENEIEVLGALIIYGSEAFPLQNSDVELARLVVQEANNNLEMVRLKGSAGQLAEAELKALRAQISPHFLFNTLNSIAALVRLDAERSRELIVDFADFFRRTLKHHGEFVPLAEELDYVAHYLRFEQVRFGKNLKVRYDITPGTESVVVPVLTVQPLVENAVVHGLAPKIGGGTIKIRTSTVDYGDVLVEVSDNGMGMESNELERVLKPERSTGLGMALSNIHLRLQKLFGPEYGIELQSKPNKGTTVSFRVPRLKKV